MTNDADKQTLQQRLEPILKLVDRGIREDDPTLILTALRDAIMLYVIVISEEISGIRKDLELLKKRAPRW
jgi:hypothetical protein